MGTFRCQQCDQYRNSHDGCEEDPRNGQPGYENELLCEECYGDVMEEIGDTPEVRQKGVFTADQLAQIAKMEAEDDSEDGE